MSLLPVNDLLADPNDVLTLSEFKQFIVDAPDNEDEDISQAIASAFEDLEAHTGRAYGQRSYDLKLERWPSGRLFLPVPPLVSVTSVKYNDTLGAEQTFNVANYTVHGVNVTGFNNQGCYGGYIKVGAIGWPDIEDADESITIRFVAGYATPNTVPEIAKRGCRIRTGKYYSSGGDSYTEEVDEHYFSVIGPLIVHSFV